MASKDERELDRALVTALDKYYRARARVDGIPDVRVELTYDPNEKKAVLSRTPHFVQAGDSHGCPHAELLLHGSSDNGPTIACAHCSKRWCRPGK
jgi:hypothetical protein